MTPTHRVFIALPVLNEIENIEPLLDRIDNSMEGHDYLVCVVDDGSRDGTREYVRRRMRETPDRLQMIERTKTQRGSQRGGALHVALEWGLDNTDCDVFVEMDGDLSHRPEELPPALDRLASSGADVIVASKFVKHSRVTNRPIGRRLVSQLCSMAVHVFLSRKVRDYSNGYRFYTRDAAEAIRVTRIRYTSPIYLSEVLAIWLRAGLRVVEIPDHLHRPRRGPVEVEADRSRQGCSRGARDLAAVPRHRFPAPRHLCRSAATRRGARRTGMNVASFVTLLTPQRARSTADAERPKRSREPGWSIPLDSDRPRRRRRGRRVRGDSALVHQRAAWSRRSGPVQPDLPVHPYRAHHLSDLSLPGIDRRVLRASARRCRRRRRLSVGHRLAGDGRWHRVVAVAHIRRARAGRLVAFQPSRLKFGFLAGIAAGAVAWGGTSFLRPDDRLAISFIAGLIALESGRLAGWALGRLCIGAVLVCLSATLHYPGSADVFAVAIYAVWVVVERRSLRRAARPLAALAVGSAPRPYSLRRAIRDPVLGRHQGVRDRSE